MTGQNQRERRSEPRIPERVRVAFRLLDEGRTKSERVSAETINLSASGLCLRASKALQAEAHLALELSLPGSDEAVMAIGRVVWCDRDEDQYRVGVCFTWMREQDRGPLKAIADFVDARTGS